MVSVQLESRATWNIYLHEPFQIRHFNQKIDNQVLENSERPILKNHVSHRDTVWDEVLSIYHFFIAFLNIAASRRSMQHSY